MKQWLCPEGEHVAFAAADVQVGGAYRIDMLGQRMIIHRSIYREIVPPRKLAFTWESVNTQGQETVVTVELLPGVNRPNCC